jgi:hypothetical protein
MIGDGPTGQMDAVTSSPSSALPFYRPANTHTHNKAHATWHGREPWVALYLLTSLEARWLLFDLSPSYSLSLSLSPTVQTTLRSCPEQRQDLA